MKRTIAAVFLVGLMCASVFGQAPDAPNSKEQDIGSRKEDFLAQRLLGRGDLHYELGEPDQAAGIYESVIHRYPRSKFRFTAYLKLGKYHLKKDNYHEALDHFTAAQGTEERPNENPDEVAEAMFCVGRTFYEQRMYSKAAVEFRKVTVEFPGTDHANQAFYYLGLGHYYQRHYSRAIEAFERVGTAIHPGDLTAQRMDAGRPLFVRVDDMDLNILKGESRFVDVEVATTGGDAEKLRLKPLGITGRTFLSPIPTELGAAKPGDGVLQLSGPHRVSVKYVDTHTAEAKQNAPREHTVSIAGHATVAFVDGAYQRPTKAVALGKSAFIRVRDSDRDLSKAADTVKVRVRSKFKLAKTKEAEAAARKLPEDMLEPEGPQYQKRDEIELTLSEYAPEQTGEVHSGIFTGRADLTAVTPETVPNPADGVLHCDLNDILELEYVDEVNTDSEGPLTRTAAAEVARGRLDDLEAVASVIEDPDLRVRTRLKKAEAIAMLGKIFKDMGLKERAYQKFDEALDELKAIALERGAFSAELLEQTQFLLWKVYFEKDEVDRATEICARLVANFPDSRLVDDALLAMAQAAQKKKDYHRAISIYMRLLRVKNTPFRPDAQFNIARCHEELGVRYRSRANLERALTAYKECFEKYPLSRYASESIVKIANFYYEQKDYQRAIDIYDRTLADYPDAKFVDIVIFNYGKCLYRMKEYHLAEQRFMEIITNYPDSSYVPQAKQAVELCRMRKAEPSGTGRNAEE